MALIKCTECGKEISDKATSCPNCGCPIEDSAQNKTNESINNTVKGSYTAPVKTDVKPERRYENKNHAPKVLIGIIILCVLLKACSLLGEDSSDKEKDVSSEAVVEQTEKPVEKAEDKKSDNDTKKKKTDNDTKNKKSNKTKKEKATKKPVKNENKKQFIDSCKEYNYKKVLRNPDKYVGKKVKVKVKISSVHDKSVLNPDKYYFAYSNDKYDMWLGNQYAITDKRSEEKPKLLEDDIVMVYGTICDTAKTTSLIVNSEELFAIDMKYCKLISE